MPSTFTSTPSQCIQLCIVTENHQNCRLLFPKKNNSRLFLLSQYTSFSRIPGYGLSRHANHSTSLGWLSRRWHQSQRQGVLRRRPGIECWPHVFRVPNDGPTHAVPPNHDTNLRCFDAPDDAHGEAPFNRAENP